MTLERCVAVTLVVVIASTGVGAAVPGTVPATADGTGPPDDLPGPVPSFVEDIIGAIGNFLVEDLAGTLGETVSGLTPGGDGNASAPANASG